MLKFAFFALVLFLSLVILGPIANAADAGKFNCREELKIKQRLIHEAEEMQFFSRNGRVFVAEAQIDLIDTQLICKVLRFDEYCEKKATLLGYIFAEQRALESRSLVHSSVLANTVERQRALNKQCQD
jgi:hypothetical protein